MPAIPNKQPVFTVKPLLYSITIDQPTSSDNNNPTPYDIFTSSDDAGTLIERITIISAADTINYPNVIDKLIYLYIFEPKSERWILYKTATIPATTVNDTTPPPQVEWTFQGGLIMPPTYKLGVAASQTFANGPGSTTTADNLAITIEGGLYTL
jgi:hypothetical protein